MSSIEGKVSSLRNHAKEQLDSGGSIVVFGLTSASVSTAQILARSGADMLIVDMEHACIDVNGAQILVGTDVGPSCSCIVRLPAKMPSLMRPILDAGALGLTFPMITSAEELANAVQGALYYPLGSRAIGPHTAPARWRMDTAEYLNRANENLLFNVLIETREAVDAIEEIVKVPRLSIATIGLGDLAANLGRPSQLQSAEVKEAVAHIERVVLESRVALGGITTSSSDIVEKRQRGYRSLVVGFDVTVLLQAASNLVNLCKT